MENNQRVITPKICKQELWFLCMTHQLIMLYKCTKFHCNISYGFGVIERTRFVMDRQTDGRTERNSMSPDPSGGDMKKKFSDLINQVSEFYFSLALIIFLILNPPHKKQNKTKINNNNKKKKVNK